MDTTGIYIVSQKYMRVDTKIFLDLTHLHYMAILAPPQDLHP